jgi:hypothetical protein
VRPEAPEAKYHPTQEGGGSFYCYNPWYTNVLVWAIEEDVHKDWDID